VEAPHADHLRGHVHPDEPTAAVRYRWLALIVLCLAIFISTVDTTVVTVALPEISSDLGASTSQLQWILDSYTIALAGFILLGGGLADRFGRKRVFMSGLGLFALTSLLATFASSAGELIVYRAAMGLGAALIFPPALSLVAVIFSPVERRVAIAVWSVVAGAGLALGPVIGGALLNEFWWGSAFFVNVPVAVIGVVAALVLLPESRRPGAPPLDLVGAALSVLALGSLIYGIIEGPNVGWATVEVGGALGLGVVAVWAFIAWELRQQDPLFDVRVLGNPAVLAGFTTLFLFYIAFLGIEFVIPQYLQSVEGETALAAGLVMIPLGIGQIVLAPFTPRLLDRVGPRRLMTGTLAGIGVGAVVLSLLTEAGGVALIVAGLVIISASLALGFAPATAVVLNALPVAKAGDGSEVNQLARQVGAAFGIALIGSILAGVYSSELASETTALTDRQSETVDQSLSDAQKVAGDLGGARGAALTDAADDAFERGAEVSLWAIAGLSAAAALIVFALLRGTRSGVGVSPVADTG
jgi:MFS transporter, DHA2 family, multidrug resistance protein